MSKSFADHAVRTASLDRMVQDMQSNVEIITRYEGGTVRFISHQSGKGAAKWNEIQRRVRTNDPNFREPASVYSTPYAVERRQIFTGVADRMKATGVDTSNLVEDHYNFCLPNPIHDEAQLKGFRTLYMCPMLKTDEALSELIRLEESTSTSPPLPAGEHFYFRSWTLRPPELRQVISEMSHSDHAHPEVAEWKKVVDLFAPLENAEFDLEAPHVLDEEDSSTLPELVDPARLNNGIAGAGKHNLEFFTIRYVGKVVGPDRSPYDRFMEDLESRATGILPDFLQVLERCFPLAYDAGKAYLIKDASLVAEATDIGADEPPMKMHRDNAATRERFLVQLFDHSTLLNRMSGGWYTDYVQPQEDAEVYKSLDIDIYTNLLRNASQPDSELQSQLMAHFTEVQKFANSNSGTTGTNRHAFTDGFRNAIYQQGLPLQYRGEAVLLVAVGKDVTLSDYLSRKTFFGGESQAATLARSFFCTV